ncbi:hypothetical protein BDN72DRAFT_891431 [Pluteus cervinus]|uniref:Uncharacterized protein n=1 Tax=Pluteus cervinus TaxID=181527 RepID=A0ACD3BDD5_9AGAR|nr:hypothetical protein BDN72DRAFT_891431 [Pluteus cervinus]
MVNTSLPTPPPAAAAKLQDDGDKATSSSTNRGKPDIYQQFVLRLTDLASANSYAELIQTAEQYELKAEGDAQASRLIIVTPLILGYLVVDDLPPARLALNRLPDILGTHALARALLQLVAATWERRHAKIYARAQSLIELGKKSDFFYPDLGTLIGIMVSSFLVAFRERTFILLTDAFTSMPIALTESYLGMTSDELLPVIARKGWQYDATTRVVTPKSGNKATKEVPTGFSSFQTFHLVADSVARLDL